MGRCSVFAVSAPTAPARVAFPAAPIGITFPTAPIDIAFAAIAVSACPTVATPKLQRLQHPSELQVPGRLRWAEQQKHRR